VSGSTTSGGKVDMWVRATACLRRDGAGWRIVHEHNSAPFDPASGKAALDIKPS